MAWERAATLAELERRPRVHRSGPRQIAVFGANGRAYAIDNRCPHEGYPLAEGKLDASNGECVLTCNWHNWKFRLSDGECLLGGDHARAYPVEVRGDEVWVDVSDPPPHEVEARILEGLAGAFRDRDFGRAAREITRLHFHGLDPLAAVRAALRWSHARLEYGTTHAYAAAADWLALAGRVGDDWDRRLVCLTEAVDHMAHDALRQPEVPFAPAGEPFDEAAFAAGVEGERREQIEGMVRAALGGGLHWSQMRAAFADAALAHLNDFGHALIWVAKADQWLALDAEHRDELEPCLLLPLARSLCYTTREDLLPEFRGYAPALEALPELLRDAPATQVDSALGAAAMQPATGPGGSAAQAAAGLRGSAREPIPADDVAQLFGANVPRALAWTVERAASHTAGQLFDALLEASARHLLHFDASYQERSDLPVSQSVGWLDFTHAITFGNAVRTACAWRPSLWRAVLLQMACFVGRNGAFIDRDLDAAAWDVADAAAFLASVDELLLDHGQRDPIFACHLLKTALAVREEHAVASPRCAAVLLAALNRFLHSPLKQKHALRLARQAVALVGRDFA